VRVSSRSASSICLEERTCRRNLLFCAIGISCLGPVSVDLSLFGRTVSSVVEHRAAIPMGSPSEGFSDDENDRREARARRLRLLEDPVMRPRVFALIDDLARLAADLYFEGKLDGDYSRQRSADNEEE